MTVQRLKHWFALKQKSNLISRIKIIPFNTRNSKLLMFPISKISRKTLLLPIICLTDANRNVRMFLKNSFHFPFSQCWRITYSLLCNNRLHSVYLVSEYRIPFLFFLPKSRTLFVEYVSLSSFLQSKHFLWSESMHSFTSSKSNKIASEKWNNGTKYRIINFCAIEKTFLWVLWCLNVCDFLYSYSIQKVKTGFEMHHHSVGVDLVIIMCSAAW